MFKFHFELSFCLTVCLVNTWGFSTEEIIQSCCQALCSKIESTHQQSTFYMCRWRNKMWQLGTFNTPWKLGTLKHHRWAISPHMGGLLLLRLFQLAANCYFSTPSTKCKMPMRCHIGCGDDNGVFWFCFRFFSFFLLIDRICLEFKYPRWYSWACM